MNNKVFSFKESFRGIGKRVLKGAAITYASLLGLSSVYQVISHLQIKNYLERQNDPKAKKVLVVSSGETNIADKIVMTILQPIYGFPGYDMAKQHKTFLEWPIRSKMAELGYSVHWLSHPSSEQITFLDQTASDYQGLILIGHGGQSYFAGHFTRISKEKDFILKLTCNKGISKNLGPDTHINIEAPSLFQKDVTYQQSLSQRNLNARRIFTYQGDISLEGIILDAVLGFPKVTKQSGYEKSFTEEIINSINDLSSKEKESLSSLDSYLQKKFDRNSFFEFEFFNLYEHKSNLNKIKKRPLSASILEIVEKNLKEINKSEKTIFNLPLLDIDNFYQQAVGRQIYLKKITEEYSQIKNKLSAQILKDWALLLKKDKEELKILVNFLIDNDLINQQTKVSLNALGI